MLAIRTPAREWRAPVVLVAAGAGLVVLGQVAARREWVDHLTWSAPTDIVATLWDGLASGDLWRESQPTLTSTLLGIAFALVIGTAVSVPFARYPSLYAAVEPFLLSYYAVPIFIMYPLVLAIVGSSTWPYVVIGFVMASPGLIVNTTLGLQRVPGGLLKYAKSIGLPQRQVYRRITIPAVLPYWMAGVRLAVIYGVVAVIGAEFLLGTSGIGRRMVDDYNTFQTTEMYAVMLYIIAALTVINGALSVIERRLRQSSSDHAVNSSSKLTIERSAFGSSRTGRLVSLAAVPATVAVVWALSAQLGSSAIPEPSEVVRRLADGIDEGWLQNALASSLRLTAMSFVVSVGLGVAIGNLIAVAGDVGHRLEQVIGALYGIPKLLVYPVVLLVFGLNDSALIAFGVLHGVFPVIMMTATALRSVAPSHLKLARSLQLGHVAQFRHIGLPSSLPEILAGLRLGFTLSFLGVVVGEVLFGVTVPLGGTASDFEGGIGGGIMLGHTHGDLVLMSALALVALIVAIVFNVGALSVERFVRARRGEV